MRLLAIDTSGPMAGAATHAQGHILCHAQAEDKRTHSESIMQIIDFVLFQSGWAKGDIEAVAATTGPGSFTGLRIGLSIAKSMAQALKIPCIGVDTLDTLCYAAKAFPLRCAVMDARRSEVYCAAYLKEELVVKHGVRSLSDFLESVSAVGMPAVFVGDGIRAYRDEIVHTFKEASFMPEPYALQSAASVAELAAAAEKRYYMDAFSLKPNYYRLSQAEREVAQKQHEQR